MVRLGIIGYGYWGPNVARNFASLTDAEVVSVCDRDEHALARAHTDLASAKTTVDSDDILESADIDAVAIITPAHSHFALAKKALLNDKHIFVEKPFTATVAQAEELIELADKKDLKIMVDHTFVYVGAVRKIKEFIDDGSLGDLYYFDSTRINLGLFQHDVNVIWDLAPHDLSIIDFLISEKPEGIVATGIRHFDNSHEDVAYLSLYFPNNLIAHINVNWLSPVKIRTTLIGGSKKMLVWNDLEPDEKLKVYDKGVDINDRQGLYSLLISYRSGDMWAPRPDPTEALKLETQAFVDNIINDTTPVNDGPAGLRVVRTLEAASESILHKGKFVYL